MCGITAAVGADDAVSTLLTGLQNLEYRGYDSAGVAVADGGGVEVLKREGKVDELADLLSRSSMAGRVGLGHTRWSTHGPPTNANAHPHTDCYGDLAVVHNGIIENHGELRERLSEMGHTFSSDTDTEVVPHLVEAYVDEGESVEGAFRRAIGDLSGSYAVAMVHEDEEAVYAARQGSPLVFGVSDDSYYLASDVPAFLEFTDDVVYLEDSDVVRVTPEGYDITDIDGTPVERSVETVDWTSEDVEKGAFDHYMRKEIDEQPTAIAQAVRGRADGDEVAFESLSPGAFADVERVHFVACGTSYHAALYGAQLLRDRGVPARAYLASEYAVTAPPTEDGTVLVGVTQSGETADTLAALRRGAAEGLGTLAVTNVVGSTAARECDDTVLIRAGPEIGVAATKTFSSQVATLGLLAERIAREVGGSGSTPAGLPAALDDVPDAVETILADSSASALATRYDDSDAYFFIGRGTGHPVALEGALKLKEISYEHAEGFPAGELKHGPLALVTPSTPVFAICTGQHTEKLVGSIEEVSARGAPVVAVAPRSERDVAAVADDVLWVPETHPELVGVLANVQLQLLSYHTATLLDRPVDKPRNLAKSVTVE
ncbi:glucosamine--fructose-6-phosphate aminotransferase [Halosimplex carlsbadense 2-9-1]|uniref:Glutamine--fructose-6-phosphate aminotransferase [isomerizing] n=1 Tax=Halosimplex carlsbadense 2-9-1 TaxID=797114 RepID=M0CI59_9EURY|nr:glutamine--fructose-6-phosphate transaminase (isomerizing) [Halosimplex carlsbadense]ELZ22328.1 glucosamine--fructose-6-phosphate aminotransferase [Halosimplex carlsbadense 2-9-1]